MATQTLSTFSIENKQFYERALLERLKETYHLYKYAKKTTLPKHHGNSISWRKFLDLEIPTSALTEGVTPTANKLEIVEFTAQLSQYGDFIAISDLLDFEGIDPIITETSQLFGEQIAEFVDTKIREVLITGTNVFYAGGEVTSSAEVSATISIDDINKVKAILKRYKAPAFEKGLYVWFISPEVEYDLKSLTASNSSWVDVAKYANPDSILDGEIGTFLGFKWVVDNNIVADENGVYKCLVLGKDAFGTVNLEGDSSKPQIIHKPLGSSGTEDPLNQRQTLGWKINGLTTRILQDEGVLRYECVSSLTDVEGIDEEDRTHYSTKNTQE